MKKEKKQGFFESSEKDVFNVEDLFAIQGGEDEDFDGDCYVAECIIANVGPNRPWECTIIL